jgi:hypothetical protein
MTITLEDLERAAALDTEILAAGIHEAAHAVVGYMLGLGCVSIMIRPDWRDDRVAIGGMAKCSKAGIAMVNATIRRLSKGKSADVSLLSDYTVMCMAGFAAELKFRRETEAGLPNPNVMNDDVIEINNINLILNETRSHRHHDSGRRTDAILNTESVWEAVIEIGETLASELSDRLEADVSDEVTMTGTAARAIMRKHGVRLRDPGLLTAPRTPSP